MRTIATDFESFRRFLISSTCLSFIPESYLRDPEVFPEKEGESGSIHIEAADKVELKKFRDITFINTSDVLGIIYSSRSGNTNLKWRQINGATGKLTGEASGNSLVNLLTVRAITRDYAENLATVNQPETDTPSSSIEEEVATINEQVPSSTSEDLDLDDNSNVADAS